MEKKTHCHFCGKPLIQRFIEGRERLFCIGCKRPIYENPIPATCVVTVNSQQQILLVRRSVEPKLGQWCLPGGFLELEEPAESGALRELAEETGLAGEIETLLGVRTTPSHQYHSILIIAYSICNIKGQAVAGDDADKVLWSPYDQLPSIAFDSHRYFIDLYFRKSTPRDT